MKILVTGAKGFVGKNLVESLKNIKSGKDKTRPNLKVEETCFSKHYSISQTSLFPNESEIVHFHC